MTAKPIDWLKPLRPAGIDNQIVRVVGIDPTLVHGIEIANLVTGARRMVNRAGFVDHGDHPIVENVPPKLKIIERWILVHRTIEHPSGYIVCGPDIVVGRDGLIGGPFIAPGCRHAKLLIEEPGE